MNEVVLLLPALDKPGFRILITVCPQGEILVMRLPCSHEDICLDFQLVNLRTSASEDLVPL